MPSSLRRVPCSQCGAMIQEAFIADHEVLPHTVPCAFCAAVCRSGFDDLRQFNYGYHLRTAHGIEPIDMGWFDSDLMERALSRTWTRAEIDQIVDEAIALMRHLEAQPGYRHIPVGESYVTDR